MTGINSFDYQLPPKHIAHQPAEPRSSSKLMQVDRATGEIKHWHFSDLPTLLQPGDVLVRNDTKVLPARLFGKLESGKQIEVLLIHPNQSSQDEWFCLTKPGVKQDQTIIFDDELQATNRSDKNSYSKILRFSLEGKALKQKIDDIGHTPLPPYINPISSEKTIRRQYQTTYAKFTGSVAAPTAGLHFTPDLDEELRRMGVEIVSVTLHVGLGTFMPLREHSFEEKQLHEEYFSLDEASANAINKAKAEGRRIIAVGTTAVRTLESCVDEAGLLQARTGETRLFIFPPFQFRVVDAMITNFHLPKSSLLALVSAFVSQPNTTHNFTSFSESIIGESYQVAMNQNYRFYSFGDAMLIGYFSSPPNS